LELKNIEECLGLVLVARYKNWPYLILAKHQTANNFCPGCENSTYCIWFLGRKMRPTKLVLKK